MNEVSDGTTSRTAGRSRTENATLLVFSDDWGRHPSSCQHLIQRLKGRYEVLWVNTIGMRPPSFGWSTMSRGLEKVRHWTVSRDSSGENATESPRDVSVLNPKMWPWFRRRHDRVLNRRLLLSQIRNALEGQSGPIIAITTIPIVADLMGELPVDRWIYYCVDDFATWPGLDQKTLAGLEADVIRRADVLVAASAVLKNRLEETRDSVALLTHGVELEHWSVKDVPPHEALETLEKPLAVFWGLVDRRLDLDFLARLSDRMSCGSIVLVGPEDQPDPALQRIPRVRRVCAIPYEELPQIAKASDALILPYRDAAVTRAMQPLKLLEYLATGKAVVARNLPATRSWTESLDLADSAETFAALVLKRLEAGLPPEQQVDRQRLSDESWDARAAEFEDLIFS